MKGKKLFSLLLVAVLSMSLFLFTACSGQQTPQNPGPQIEQGGGTGDDPGTSGDTGSGDDTGSGGSEEVPPPVHVHSAQHTAAVAPTCTTAGNVDYWYCSGCEKYFRDEQCTEEIKGGVTLPAGHKNVEHVTRREATCTEDGNKEYYHCRDCNKYFSDSSYQTEITDRIIQHVGHIFSGDYKTSVTEHWKKCENCTEEQRAAHEFGGDNECNICGYVLPVTEGLEYTDISVWQTSVTGIGAATAETDIIIPMTHNGRTVVSIGSKAFQSCGNLISVTIPSSVTSISDSAFQNCYNLQTVNWNATKCDYSGKSDDRVYYNYTIFKNCSALTTVNIGENVQTIPDYAFCGCDSLTEITIPSKVTAIGKYAFANCANLNKVNWNATNCTKAGKQETEIYPFEYKVVFYHNPSVININIGENVQTIPDYAFSGCRVTSIIIPQSVTYIGDNAFVCPDLQPSIIENNVEYLGNGDNPYLYLLGATSTSITSCTINERTKFIGTKAFYKCSNLTEITVPANVISIGELAFYECANLQTVNWNATNCTNIEMFWHHDPEHYGYMVELYNIFHNCQSITNINIGANVQKFPTSVLEDCDNLQPFVTENNVKYLGSRDNPYLYLWKATSTSITSCTINERTKIIGGVAFKDCSSLTEITIPASVTFIDVAFDNGCTNLSIDVDPDNMTYSSQDGIVYNYEKTSFVCIPKGIRGAVVIPEGITSIPARAFRDCEKFTEITIPASVTFIGDYAFYGCFHNLVAAKFENPYGWKSSGGDLIFNSYDPSISPSRLQDPAKAARALTYNYYASCWARS